MDVETVRKPNVRRQLTGPEVDKELGIAIRPNNPPKNNMPQISGMSDAIAGLKYNK